MVTRRKQDLGQRRSTIYAFVWRSSSPVRTGRIEKVLPSKRMLSVYDLALTGNSVTRGIIVGNIFSRILGKCGIPGLFPRLVVHLEEKILDLQAAHFSFFHRLILFNFSSFCIMFSWWQIWITNIYLQSSYNRCNNVNVTKT